MILQARMLTDVGSVNVFDVADAFEMTQGDVVDCYFQLIDATLDRASDGFKPGGRRYMPAAGATLSVVVDNIDDSIKITRAATQPYPQDPSIWKISFTSTDTIRGTCALALTLRETGKTTTGRTEAAVLIRNAGTL